MNLARRRMVIAGLLGGGAFALAGCIFQKSVTRNIRVIAQAEVAGNVVEGSAVMSLRWKAGDGSRMYHSSNAEAVVLDLNGRGTVFLLNSWISDNRLNNIGYWHVIVSKTIDLRGNGQLSDFPKIKALQGRYPIRSLVDSPPPLPLMVSFVDETKRETMFEVKPDDFADLFGKDVRFLDLWFEFTDDEATSLIPTRLPVGVKPNPSFKDAFPKRGADGKLIPAVDDAFPYKVGSGSFWAKGF